MSYSIIDETHKNKYQEFAVNPIWPLLGVMLLGGWFGYSWFVVNSLLLSSYYKKREIAAILIAISFSIIYWFVAIYFYELLQWPNSVLKYLFLVLITVKLATGYYVYLKQSHSFALFEYYNNFNVRNGGLILAVAFILFRKVELAKYVPFWLEVGIA